MKNIYKIDESVFLKISKYTNIKTYKLYDKGEEIVLSEMEESSYIISNVAFDKDYVVIYTENKLVDDDTVVIDSVYDIKNKRFLNIKNNKELITDIKYTYILKHEIDLKVILSIINVSKLKNVDESAIESAIKYFSADSDEINKKDIIYYIFKTYPELINHRFVDPCISNFELRKIAKSVGGDKLSFFKIPHTLNDISKENEKSNNRKLEENLMNFRPLNNDFNFGNINGMAKNNDFSFEYIYHDDANKDEEYNDVMFEKKLDRLNLANSRKI